MSGFPRNSGGGGGAPSGPAGGVLSGTYPNPGIVAGDLSSSNVLTDIGGVAVGADPLTQYVLLAGRSSSQQVFGATTAGGSLFLSGTANGSPTAASKVSIEAGGADRFAVYMSTGRILMGNDPAYGNMNAQVTMRRGTAAGVTQGAVIGQGTGLALVFGDDDVPSNTNAELSTIVGYLGVGAGSPGVERNAFSVQVYSQATDALVSVGRSSRIWQEVTNTTAGFVVFGDNIVAQVGAPNATGLLSTDPNVTSSCLITGIEIDANDRSQSLTANAGFACRLETVGANDITSALLVLPNTLTAATFLNAIVCSSGNKGSMGFAAYSNSNAYAIYQGVSSGGRQYYALQAQASGGGQTAPAAGGNAFWQDVTSNAPRNNFIWYGPVSASGGPTGSAPLFQCDNAGNVNIGGTLALLATNGTGYMNFPSQSSDALNVTNVASLYAKNYMGKIQMLFRSGTGATKVMGGSVAVDPGATVTGTTAATTLFANALVSIPSSSVTVGDMFRITCGGQVSIATTGDTYVIALKLGSTVVTTITTANSITGSGSSHSWAMELLIYVDAIGSGGSVTVRQLFFMSGAGVAGISATGTNIKSTAGTAISFAANQAIDIQSTSSASGNSITCSDIVIEKVSA